MAKKTIAGYNEKRGGRSYSKVIKMYKSHKGVYTFREEMVPNEIIKDYFK